MKRCRPRVNPTDAAVRRMRIVVLEMPDIDEASDRDVEAIGEWSREHCVEWGRGSGVHFSRESYVSEPVPLLASAARLRRDVSRLRVHDVTRDYLFARTQCPRSYDGFGTIWLASHTIVPEQGLGRGRETVERFVAIRREYENWQLTRYASGICSGTVIAR